MVYDLTQDADSTELEALFSKFDIIFCVPLYHTLIFLLLFSPG